MTAMTTSNSMSVKAVAAANTWGKRLPRFRFTQRTKRNQFVNQFLIEPRYANSRQRQAAPALNDWAHLGSTTKRSDAHRLEFRVYAARAVNPTRPRKRGTPNDGASQKRPERFIFQNWPLHFSHQLGRKEVTLSIRFKIWN